MIRRLLTTNRGEIAVRIICTCKGINIETVVVYSTADKGTLHVQPADYVVYIGGPRVNDNYLNMKNILSAACMTACDAIRPGFGSPSEDAKFARLVLQCDLIFVGPSPDVVEQIGDKNNVRRCMTEARVLVIPGSKDLLETMRDTAAMTEKIGYPVLIKAGSGGGGHGIHCANYAEELVDVFDAAETEARANLGDDAVYMEKFVVEPGRIGVQLMVDKHGNVIHLYKCDYSCQRRNQKLLEETPCRTLEEDVCEHLLCNVVHAVESVGYDSVGTVEFLLDARRECYFMKMNTRIRVEYTTSEEICGIDLIKQQIRVADGHKLTCRQGDIVYRGHAIECRINVENIKYNFTPSPGQISFINFPLGRRVRIEGVVYNNYNMPSYYDSTIAKVITYMDTRLECVKRMRSALGGLLIEDVEANIGFQYLLLHHPIFVGGCYDTGLMESLIKELKEGRTVI